MLELATQELIGPHQDFSEDTVVIQLVEYAYMWNLIESFGKVKKNINLIFACSEFAGTVFGGGTVINVVLVQRFHH